MAGFLKKIFGTAQSRKLKKYRAIVTRVNAFEKQYQLEENLDLPEKTEELKKRFQEGASLDELLPEAYALVKYACRSLVGTEIHVSGYNQKWDMVPYDVQILGGIAMHFGNIAEMQTGEGKTLTASMPLYLNALTGKPVHLVTVNDYLAERDCQWIGGVFRKLGLTVSALTNNTPPNKRKSIYESDIVYGTASEFGFDYLRDNSMAHTKEEQCQRGFYFAIVDEIDSILIDEARTPLIISGPAPSSYQMYDILKDPVAKLVRLQRDYCNQLATKGKKILDSLGMTKEDKAAKKLSKEEAKREEEAYKNLWLVLKGTPQSKVLKRLREFPDIRAKLEQWDTYFYAEPNKAERLSLLSELYIIVDERSSDYEITDKGIQTWGQTASKSEGEVDDFVMLDLSHEYTKIDQDSALSESDKLNKKVAALEEDAKRKERAHNLRQLFRAHLLMEKDVDYIVSEGKIVIIDENTGRPQPGRRFSDGLHQAIEAKESLAIQKETQTYATITLQNYFRMYDKLSGMTGTAITEASEFYEIYKIDVLEIPTHRPCLRKDFDDEIYMTEREKYQAIIKNISELHKKGVPILVGTESVEESEKLSRILRQHKLPHTVLNAKNHEKEAEIIANAGRKGAITVATNMAGRGTDIKLEEGVAAIGGLAVVGTTRHQSRRIDRQLRGRSARQGDIGSSQFYVSFEDTLMRLFTSPKLTAFLQRFRPPEGEAISAKILNHSIETAQKRIEQRHYSIRKHTLEYDNVMNKQRKEVYAFRNQILHSKETVSIALHVLDEFVQAKVDTFFADPAKPEEWKPQAFSEDLSSHFPLNFQDPVFQNLISSDYASTKEIIEETSQRIHDAFYQKLEGEALLIAKVQKASNKEVNPVHLLTEIIRSLLLRAVDRYWQQHLLAIDHLRSDVNLRTVGQKDPLMEFKHEAFLLFNQLGHDLRMHLSRALFKFEMTAPQSKGLQQAIKKLQKETFPTFFPRPSLEDKEIAFPQS